MKTSDLILLGAVGVGGYILYNKLQTTNLQPQINIDLAPSLPSFNLPSLPSQVESTYEYFLAQIMQATGLSGSGGGAR